MSSGNEIIYPNDFRSVAAKGTDHKDSSIAQVDDMVEQPMCYRVTKMVDVPTRLQALILGQAPATE